MTSTGIEFGQRRAALLLAVAILLLGPTVAARAATILSIVIAGEPWEDPSISSVGTKLSVSTPPSGGTIALGWSTTTAGAMGVRWQVARVAHPPLVLLSGAARLPKAAAPGATYWIFVPATFLAPHPPTTPNDYQITVTPYDAKQSPIGAASPAVVVTQVVDKGPGPTFGHSAIFPELEAANAATPKP
jgi:hypothetical protein